MKAVFFDLGGVMLLQAPWLERVERWERWLRLREGTLLDSVFGGSDDGPLIGAVDE